MAVALACGSRHTRSATPARRTYCGRRRPTPRPRRCSGSPPANDRVLHARRVFDLQGVIQACSEKLLKSTMRYIRTSIGVAGILWLVGCAFPWHGDRLIRLTGQVETSEQDCRLRVLESNGSRVVDHRIDSKFSTGFAARPGLSGYRAEIVCRDGQLVSRQYDLNLQDSRTVDLGDGP